MKKLFYLSFSINVLLVALFIAKRIYYSSSGKIDWHAADRHNEEKTRLFASFDITSNDVVFIGSSLTEAFPVSEYFHARNRGIASNTILHLINRIDQITSNCPRKIFIEIGLNDILQGNSLDTIKARYTRLLDKIREGSPQTHIYIQSVLPTSGEYSHANPMVIQINNFLSTIRRNDLTYIDIYGSFAINGRLNERLTIDGAHINNEGYKVWYKAIKEYTK